MGCPVNLSSSRDGDGRTATETVGSNKSTNDGAMKKGRKARNSTPERLDSMHPQAHYLDLPHNPTLSGKGVRATRTARELA